ncbi:MULTISPECIES: ABC transporter ATP-binding protein [unclassified Curtobacterium]|uniref:ABC transporter ATP-binding protein n=1 Tax=unclassified Curtobacterium TaxID=257496 RepID=UPI000DA93F59|nr:MULTISPECIES: ABC transporter ATP-binding protein [unclassified Curtobacterium]PZF41704.1 ABC transporter ATP-binding protein [Curtobacterium sp. MCLR17_053]PZF52096.1 ABC transporter ATP-binding protein [Curtobacterium sp. MCLR17_051]
MTEPLLQAHDLTKSFPGPEQSRVPVLRGVSLSVLPGEFVAVVGPSGSGKSTLLYCLSALEPYDSGSVSIAGQRLETLRPKQLQGLRRSTVGFVFQSFNLIPSLTARQNIALPASLAHRPVSAAQVDAALASVGLADRGDHRPGALSGGQQQRVAIARVLASEPHVVFADEPTGALDTTAGDAVLDLLRRVADGDRSVVMVTHDLEAAARADRVLVLRDGAVHRELAHPDAAEVLEALTAAAQEA